MTQHFGCSRGDERFPDGTTASFDSSCQTWCWWCGLKCGSCASKLPVLTTLDDGLATGEPPDMLPPPLLVLEGPVREMEGPLASMASK